MRKLKRNTGGTNPKEKTKDREKDRESKRRGQKQSTINEKRTERGTHRFPPAIGGRGRALWGGTATASALNMITALLNRLAPRPRFIMVFREVSQCLSFWVPARKRGKASERTTGERRGRGRTKGGRAPKHATQQNKTLT
jgi:hypothetical protein